MSGGARRWSLERRERLHDGRHRIERVCYRRSRHDGADGDPLEGELLARGDVVGVLIHDPRRDEVLLVEQFRLGATRGCPERRADPWLWEIVAGRVEANETPPEAARRETREEAGLDIELEALAPIARYLPIAGTSTDEVFLYVAETDLAGAGGRYGLAHEHEDLRARTLPSARALAMLEAGEIVSAPSVIALQWLALRRARGATRAEGRRG